MRTLRRVLFWMLDIAAIVVVVACILHFSRRQSVACAWHGTRASCAVEAENPLGQVEREEIDGIRGAAYLNGGKVDLVTGANDGEDAAPFDTRRIVLERPADAKALYDFADRRSPDRVAFVSGVAHPLRTTAALFAALLAWAIVSSRARPRRADV